MKIKTFFLLLMLAASVKAEEKTVVIGGYQLTSVRTESESSAAVWEKIESKLRPILTSKLGVELNSDSVLDFRKAIEAQLGNSELVGGKVTEVKSQPLGDHQVMIEFMIDPGDKVNFGFIGNVSYSKSDLTELVEEQKQIGLGRDYIESIKNKIEAFYRAQAFVKVDVQVRTQESKGHGERKVIYYIQEGERHRIAHISFDGVPSFEEQVLQEKFMSKAPIMIEKGYYSEKEAEKTAQSLVEWIRSQGFLSAKLVSIKSQVNETSPDVDVKVYIYEGDQTLVRHVEVRGAQAMTPAELKQTLGLQEGSPLNIFSFNEGLESIKLHYRNAGYLSFKIENEGQPNVVQYTNKNRWADIELNFNEGPQYVAGKISVEGLEMTKTDIVTRELQYQEGEVLEEKKLFESEAKLRRLGIFSDVKTKLTDVPGKPTVKDITLQIQEAQRGLASTGFGVRNDIGMRVFGDITYANLFQSNHTWSLSATSNRRFVNVNHLYNVPIEGIDYEVRMNYTWPWFGFRELTFRPEILNRRFMYELFRDETTQLSLLFERPLLKKWGLVAALTYSLQRTQQTLANFNVDNTAFTVGSITPSLRIDQRDNALTPTKGYFLNASFEFASPSLGSQTSPVDISYWRWLTRSDFHIPVAKSASIYFSVRTGFAKNLVSPGQYAGQVAGDGVTPLSNTVGVPLFKQFALGGINSVRGFTFQGINVGNRPGSFGTASDFQIQGTMSYVNYRTQIDFPVSDSLKMGPFVDAANLLVDDFSFNRYIRYGAGFGIRYMTPIGPANFDWGFNLDPQFNPTLQTVEPSNQFYFSLGVI